MTANLSLDQIDALHRLVKRDRAQSVQVRVGRGKVDDVLARTWSPFDGWSLWYVIQIDGNAFVTTQVPDHIERMPPPLMRLQRVLA